MRAGERRRPRWPTRFGWSAWLLRAVAWGLAGLGAVWRPAGLGAMWCGVRARVRAAVVRGKGGASEDTPDGAGWAECAFAPGRLSEEASGLGWQVNGASGPGRQVEEASGGGRALEDVSGPGRSPGGASDLGQSPGGASDPSRRPGSASDWRRLSGGAADPSRRSEGVSNPGSWPEGASDPRCRPQGAGGPSGLPEARGVSLREAENLEAESLARFQAAGCDDGDEGDEGDEAVVVPPAPAVLCLRPSPAGIPAGDGPHATADLRVRHPQTGVLRVCHPETDVAPALGRTRPSRTSGQPPHAHLAPENSRDRPPEVLPHRQSVGFREPGRDPGQARSVHLSGAARGRAVPSHRTRPSGAPTRS
jgi:hypothetical protein